MVTARRVHKTAQMRLIEEQHRRCCNRPIDSIILTKISQRKGILEAVADDLLINPATMGRWIAQLDIQAEVDLIRVTNGLAALYVEGEVNDHWKLWRKIKPSINGPCVYKKCNKSVDDQRFADMWFTGVATVHEDIFVSARDRYGNGHQFPVDADVYKSQFTIDHTFGNPAESALNRPPAP